jgi:Ca2+-transporting ATPase
VAELGTDTINGLSHAEAARRLAERGPNELVERGRRGPWRILWEQLTATMVVILIIAAVVSGLLGDFKDMVAIGAIVVLFALLGFVQEYRAEKAMAALRKLAVPHVRVLRDGSLQERSARDLVPGDVILLEAGNIVPADGRLLESASLRIQEAALTGESEPVAKEVGALDGADLPLGDRRNMAYLGTMVAYGRGKALVVQTGMSTELGQIATMLQNVKQESTPLQQRLDKVGKALAVVGLAFAAAVFGLGLARGDDVRHMLLTAVSIAVAIVPEGLPAVVTITLALGAQRMLKRNALIRRLPAVETLGSVTTICSDKTGTLTENRMTVTVIDVAGHRLDLTQTFRHHVPSLNPGDLQPEAPMTPPAPIRLLLAGGALCNDASLKPEAEAGRFHTIGDPTEGALLVVAAQSGLRQDELQRALPRMAELPFDSDRKRMTTIHQLPSPNPQLSGILAGIWRLGLPYVGFTKGAVDSLLDVCSRVWVEERTGLMTPEWRQRIQAANDELAQNGMRVLGLAFRPLPALLGKAHNGRREEVEENLVFVGLIGMIDPPRPEVKEAVQTCQAAGIRPVMITGDHPLTARHIAQELGIANGGRVLTGQELSRMSAEELKAVVEEVSVYARVSPEHKLKIVQALQDKGHIVAMTGDGVNDAPALKKADIGVAMGITGTDVSKEAADMVLRDDNFATIVAAVEEGRTIYDNLRKFIKFSIAGNMGKVAVMLLSPFLGKPLPLLPVQLLWLNLLTDGLLGLGLGLEPTERNVMRRPPYSRQQGVFSQGMGRHVVWVGALIGAIALAVGYGYWVAGRENWQTMVFTTLAFAQIAQALAVRSLRESLFSIGLLSNKPLAALAAVVFALQLAVVYVPFLQDFFQTHPLTWADLGLSLALAGLVFIAIEVEKWLIRRRGDRGAVRGEGERQAT